MCCRLRSFDIFAKQVSLTYKKEEHFSTALGGICSILVGILIGSFLLSELIVLIFSPDYEYSITSTHNKFALSNKPLVITPDNLIMAGRLSFPDGRPHDAELLD